MKTRRLLNLGCTYTFVFFLSLSFAFAQEICDNALDDDADGLIDLNDPDCVCTGVITTQPQSLIPNPSFETNTCCPSGFSQMNCAVTWQQASAATTDYLNTCGFTGGFSIPTVPMPLPDGNGFVGFHNGSSTTPTPTTSQYKEYLGACLLSPMLAGTTYTLQFYLGFGTANGSIVSNSPTTIALFGTTNCGNLPFGGGNFFFGCPTNGPGFVQLGTVTVSGVNQWVQASISFTPTQNITGIVLGPDCSPATGFYYHFMDELILADSVAFSGTVGSTGSICQGNVVLQAPPAPPATTAQWYKDGIALIGETGTTYPVPIGAAGIGQYQVVFSDGTNCAATTPLYAENQLPPTLAISGDTAICTGDTTQLTATPGFDTYQWTSPLGLLNGQIVDAPDAGGYFLTATDSNGCVLNDQAIVTERPSPQPGFSAQDLACFADGSGMISLNASGSLPPYTYRIDNGPPQNNGTFSNLAAGTYSLTIEDASNCTWDSLVTLNEPPQLTASILSQTDVSCRDSLDGSISLQANGGTPLYTYSVDGINFQPSNVFPALAGGAYNPIVRDANGCEVLLNTTLQEPDAFVLSLVRVTDVACFGDLSGEILVQGSGGTAPYQYGLNSGPTGPTRVFRDLSAGTYSVQASDANGCQAELSNLDISQAPLLTATTAQQNVSCFGESDGSAEVIVQGGTPPYTYFWDSNPTQATAQATGLPARRYEVRVIDSLGCIVFADATLTQPSPLELSLVDLMESVCDFNNGMAEVSVQGGTGPYLIEWDTPQPRIGTQQSDLPPGTYTVRVTDLQACRDSLSLEIPLVGQPDAFFVSTPVDTTVVILSEAQFRFENHSTGAISYQWDFGDQVGNSSDPDPFYTYTEPGEYLVTLIARNQYGDLCPDSFQVQLIVIPDGKLYVPNAFTPNGDGINESFYALGEGITQYEMLIFDRWGTQVAQLNDLQVGWDGYWSGAPAPEGVYVFVIKATNNRGDAILRQGTVTLIR